MKKLDKDLTSKLDDIRSELDAAAQEARDFMDEKSEKWRDGDAGTSYAAWIEQIEEVASALENLPYSPE